MFPITQSRSTLFLKWSSWPHLSPGYLIAFQLLDLVFQDLVRHSKFLEDVQQQAEHSQSEQTNVCWTCCARSILCVLAKFPIVVGCSWTEYITAGLYQKKWWLQDNILLHSPRISFLEFVYSQQILENALELRKLHCSLCSVHTEGWKLVSRGISE